MPTFLSPDACSVTAATTLEVPEQFTFGHAQSVDAPPPQEIVVALSPVGLCVQSESVMKVGGIQSCIEVICTSPDGKNVLQDTLASAARINKVFIAAAISLCCRSGVFKRPAC